MKRRRFLKTAGGGVMLFGSGLLGVPLGACRTDEGEMSPSGADLADMSRADIDALEEMSPEEVEDFVAQVDASIQDLTAQVDSGDRPRIPPGQHAVESMPTLGSNSSPLSQQEWRFSITGEVDNPIDLTWAQFEDLTHVDLTCDIHCVTTWTLLDTQWNGVSVAHLLDLAQVTDRGRYVIFDCQGGYTTNIPIEEALKPNVLIATGLFGVPLPAEHGGLARGLVPDRYFYKSGKWVTGIRVLEEDEPGYWETRGYSNTADPWTEDRRG